MRTIKVLFVCMGNICRSPTAEGVFTKMVKDKELSYRFTIDSAGTHAYHVGKPPDERAQQAASNRGVQLQHLRARQIHSSDFEYFDYILVMDDDNHGIVMEQCPREYRAKVKYLLDYAENFSEREVPDPYYGGKLGFERVLDMVEDASKGLLDSLQKSGQIELNT